MTTMSDLKTAIRKVLMESEIKELDDGSLVKATAKAFWKIANNTNEDQVFKDPPEVVDPILDGVTLAKSGFLDGHLL